MYAFSVGPSSRQPRSPAALRRLHRRQAWLLQKRRCSRMSVAAAEQREAALEDEVLAKPAHAVCL
ncbi:hypothetical protein EMIT0324P_11452 [Pseudomonas chlororaphis]